MKKRNAMIRGLGMLVMVPVLLAPAGCGADNGSSRGSVTSQGSERDVDGDNGGEAAVDRSIPDGVTVDGNGEDGNTTDGNVSEISDDDAVSDYFAIYTPILTEISGVLLNGYDEDCEYEYFSTGLMEKLMYEGADTVRKSLGYVLMDINGDNVPELLIGENISDGMNDGECAYIYSGYTYFEGYLISFIDGYARSSYQWMGDDSFYHFGSNGAMSSMFGTCHLSANGKNLEWDDFYFSDENNGITSYYHNNTGECDVEQSTWLNIEAEDFWKIMDTYTLKTLPFTIFLDDGTAGSSSQSTAADQGSVTMKDYYGTWLYANGASLVLNKDGSWELNDDCDNWLCSGTWEENDGTKISLLSPIGDAGNTVVADAEAAVDAAGDQIVNIDFKYDLFDSIPGGKAVLYKKP